MTYLDNAATSFPKPKTVLQTMNEYIESVSANPNRGFYKNALKTSEEINRARFTIAKLINTQNSLRIAFTKNATEAINIAIFSSVRPNSDVVISAMEHNSVTRPLYRLSKTSGIKVHIIGDEKGIMTPNLLKKAIITIRPSTVICMVSSNVTGLVNPINELGVICADSGIKFIVDASQSIGTIPFDVQQSAADYICFPGHKGLLGPQGTGCLYVSEKAAIVPNLFGGTGSGSEHEMPSSFPDILEAGTMNTPGIAGLRAGAEFVLSSGVNKIHSHKMKLISELYAGLSSNSRITIIGKSNNHVNSGVFTFNIKGMDSQQVASLLDEKYDISVRAGFHCSPLAHKLLGTAKTGAVRISPGPFTNTDDIIKAKEAITAITKAAP